MNEQNPEPIRGRPNSIEDLSNKITGLTQYLGQLNSTTYFSKPETIEGARERLAQLSITAKYIVFDLEATKRENAYLKKLIKSHMKKERERDLEQQDDTEEEE